MSVPNEKVSSKRNSSFERKKSEISVKFIGSSAWISTEPNVSFKVEIGWIVQCVCETNQQSELQ